jgi:subtilisin family serine protease
LTSGPSPWVVRLADGVNIDETVASITREAGVSARRIYRSAFPGFAADLDYAAVSRLRNDLRVRYVAEDRLVRAAGQVLPTGLSRIQVEKNATASIGGARQVDVDVAVLDTGISAHPDLDVVQQVSFTADGPADRNGHGTHVAGIIGARDNGDQVIGVAPGVRLWNVKVLERDGSGHISDVIAGIEYVMEHADRIAVANLSFAGAGIDDGKCGRNEGDPLHEAVCELVEAGVVAVAAAGNEGKEASGTVPAAYRETIAVSAIVDTDGRPGGIGPASASGGDDSFASFSNFGRAIALAAPGVDILSTWNDGTVHRLSGTSMAAAHVTGTVALEVAKGGKPLNAGAVKRLRRDLLAVAWPQTSPEGFRGDPGPEPLINAGALDVSRQLPARLMHVGSIDYLVWGARQAGFVSVGVRDGMDRPLPGVVVSLYLFSGEESSGGRMGVTSSEGYAVLPLPAGKGGCYRTAVGSLAKDGFTHAVGADASDSGFCR